MDEVSFNINMRIPNAHSLVGTSAVIKSASTRPIPHTILGAATAHDVFSMKIREPLETKKVKVDGSRKSKKPLKTGTATRHYMMCIPKTLDEMDKFPEMTKLYIIMNTTPIHTSNSATSLIEMRGYRAIYLNISLSSILLKTSGSLSRIWLNEINSQKQKT